MQIPTTINNEPPTDLNQVIKAALTGDKWKRFIEDAVKCTDQFGTQTSFSSLINFKSRDVLIDHRWSEQGWFLQVPGYVVDEYKKSQENKENTVPITKVEPISDASEKKELEALLREVHGADRRIYFW